MRILVVSDAWLPQVNGVVKTLSTISRELTAMGHQVTFVTPDRFPNVPFPPYPEIRLAFWPFRDLEEMIRNADPQAIHIATEGPLGVAVRQYCLRRGLPFTTSFHTRFPEYLKTHILVPRTVTFSFLRWFHAPAHAVMVSTASLGEELSRRGFRNLQRWSRGVDMELFRPRSKDFLDLPRPIHLYVGRVAPEKNIEAFLSLALPGTKLVVGDGPHLETLRRRYPNVVFTGALFGEDLARHYAASDVLVFPSKTDTFGLVLLEALACGVPVAAYPVPGPMDVLGDSGAGFMDEELGLAVQRALRSGQPELCRSHAQAYSWNASARQFLNNLRPFEPPFDVISASPSASSG